jgi:dUTP pyrophosphatase
MKIKIQKLHENAVIPTYAHVGDACFDLTAATVDGFVAIGATLYRDKPVTCGTGLAFAVPEGHVMLVFSRSGMGFKRGIRLANCTGIVDHGFAGEVMVRLASDAPTEDDDGDALPCHIVRPGDRVAQAMIIPVETIDFEVVEQLQLTERGTSGFGGSGS